MKSRTSETPECAAFPILWLNAGAQITHGGQVQRPREKVAQLLKAFDIVTMEVNSFGGFFHRHGLRGCPFLLMHRLPSQQPVDKSLNEFRVWMLTDDGLANLGQFWQKSFLPYTIGVSNFKPNHDFELFSSNFVSTLKPLLECIRGQVCHSRWFHEWSSPVT